MGKRTRKDRRRDKKKLKFGKTKWHFWFLHFFVVVFFVMGFIQDGFFSGVMGALMIYVIPVFVNIVQPAASVSSKDIIRFYKL